MFLNLMCKINASMKQFSKYFSTKVNFTTMKHQEMGPCCHEAVSKGLKNADLYKKTK